MGYGEKEKSRENALSIGKNVLKQDHFMELFRVFNISCFRD